MENFAAIDFETANYNRSSVCSVGIVIVREGKIVDYFYSNRPILAYGLLEQASLSHLKQKWCYQKSLRECRYSIYPRLWVLAHS